MDARDTVVSSITIRRGLFAAASGDDGCMKVIDVHGRTVVPGLIDNHNHAVPPNYLSALQFIAAHDWSFQQHSLSLAEDQLTAATFEAVNAVTPIANLRWSVAHVPQIDVATVNRFKALGAGIAAHPYKYLSDSTDVNAGPPLRMILDSGVHVGARSDSAQISTLNPWNMIYYMVTGINAGGHLVNAGQTVTRQEAMRLYTADNGWFFHEEDKIGSIEPGKLADLVVLSDDYFDSRKVPDTAIRKLRSVLMVVDGKVIYQAPQRTN